MRRALWCYSSEVLCCLWLWSGWCTAVISSKYPFFQKHYSLFRTTWDYRRRPCESLGCLQVWSSLRCGADAILPTQYFSSCLNLVNCLRIFGGHFVCVCVVTCGRKSVCVCLPWHLCLLQGVRNRQGPEPQSQVSDQWGVKWIRGPTHSSCCTRTLWLSPHTCVLEGEREINK